MKQTEGERIAEMQRQTCRFAVRYGESKMFGRIEDCSALKGMYCRVEKKPCAFYKPAKEDCEI